MENIIVKKTLFNDILLNDTENFYNLSEVSVKYLDHIKIIIYKF